MSLFTSAQIIKQKCIINHWLELLTRRCILYKYIMNRAFDFFIWQKKVLIYNNFIVQVKNKLRQTREDDIARREEAARQLDETKQSQQHQKKELRSLSISASTVEEFKRKEVIRSRPTLSASTSYGERLRALKKSRQKNDFRFCSDKLEKIDAGDTTDYPQNENATRAVNKQIIARLEQTVNGHAPNHESLPVAPDGFIPNSIVAALYRELRRESNDNDKFTDKWKPRELTEEQIAEIEKLKLKVFIQFLHN